jgi:hypothetical protein
MLAILTHVHDLCVQLLHAYSIQRLVVKYPRQEPDALAVHVRICAGGTGKPVALPRP